MFLAKTTSRLTRRWVTVAQVRCASDLSSYKAVNEPLYAYEPGSQSRADLEEALSRYENVMMDVPVVIGDEEIHTDDVTYQVAPFDHRRKLAKIHIADKALINKAIAVSQEARPAWERTPLEERAKIFLRVADLMSDRYRMDMNATTMLGQGKTIIQAEIDAAAELIDFLRFNVQFAMEMVKYKPIDTEESINTAVYRGMEGFWAAVTPFNFTAIGGHLSSAPAFMGNVVLWKPATTATLSNYTFFKILREAGLPPGVVNFIPSKGSVLGSTIAESPHLAGVNFTGSVPTFQTLWLNVAQNLSKYRTFPRLIGECGGKNFHLVHNTADVTSVVNNTIRAGFEYSGQKCSACARVYVPESLWPQIKEGLLETHKQVKLGSPLDRETFLSAVIDDKAYDSIKSYVDYAKNSPNCEVIAGGNCDNSKGYFIDPTFIVTKDPHDKMMKEEIFGPVVTIYVYPDNKFDETLDLVNTTTEFALTGAIFAQDEAIITKAADRLRDATGNFYINDKCTGSVVGQQPFGGARLSGTNDKAGGPQYVARFCSPLAIKRTHIHRKEWRYPSMEN